MAFEPDDLAADNRGSHYLTVYGRLLTGVSPERAASAMSVLEARLVKQYPGEMAGWSSRVTPLLEVAVGDQRPVLYTLLGAVGGLLLIACVNVANLLLARATGRVREISVRAALGAAPGRIFRQLLTESLVLAVLGGIGGLVLAFLGLKGLLALAPTELPRVTEAGLNAPVFLAAIVVVFGCGLGFGLVPAFQASRVNLVDAMKDGTRGSGEGRRRHWLRQALVVVETALALVLLVGAGLLMRSFVSLTSVNPGFEPRNAVTVALALAPAKYSTIALKQNFIDELTRRIAALPGVTAVGATQAMPFSGSEWVLGTAVEGRAYAGGDANLPSAGYFAVTPDYFKAMGIPLVRGRVFTARDSEKAPRVALVSQSYAARHFPNVDPIGQRINITNQPNSLWREIVGVVGDVRNRSLEAEPPAQMYEPFAQRAYQNVGVVVRTNGPVPGLAAALKREVYAVDKDQPVSRIAPLADLVAASVARQRFASTLLAVFSGLALLLAVIGLYGVISYTVSQRTAEFGLRSALGASSGDLLALVLGGAGRLALAGVALGIVAALSLSRLVESQLYGVSARDPLLYGALAALFLLVALATCWLPARRAAKVDPAVALRGE
jgi:putative ABC transport system permease protein